MKRFALIGFLLLMGCSKPDETLFTPTPDLVCVDCMDQVNHICWKQYFCGTPNEARQFINQVKAAAAGRGLYLTCYTY